MTTTTHSQAALLLHRERIQDALRSATSRPASNAVAGSSRDSTAARS